MEVNEPDRLQQAISAARREPAPSDWEATRAGVLSRLKFFRGPSQPLQAYASAQSAEETTELPVTVAARVLITQLRRAIDCVDYVINAVAIESKALRVTGVELDLTGRYGVDLVEAAEEIREAAWLVLTTTLGPIPELGLADIAITYNDLTENDPRNA